MSQSWPTHDDVVNITTVDSYLQLLCAFIQSVINQPGCYRKKNLVSASDPHAVRPSGEPITTRRLRVPRSVRRDQWYFELNNLSPNYFNSSVPIISMGIDNQQRKEMLIHS